MFDIEVPNRPKLMSVVNLGAGSGPHFLRLTNDERRLVVTDYFLVEDLAPGGIVNVEGDHKVHVINVHAHRLEPTGRSRSISIAISARDPHGPTEW